MHRRGHGFHRPWRDPDVDHEQHDRMEKHVVTGRVAAPRQVEPRRLLEQLDGDVAKRTPCQLYVPELCAAAGLERRAEVERRRFDLLTGN